MRTSFLPIPMWMWILRLKAIWNSRLRALIDYIALAFCIIIFMLLIPGFGGAATFIMVFFYLIIPGYAFTRAFFTNLTILDNVVLILATSVGMSTFTKSFLDVFISQMKISTMLVLDLISITLLAIVIVRDAHHS